jgi:type I restriction enzyme S subunit
VSFDLRPLGEVCKTTSGGTPSRSKPQYFQGTIPWVKSGELPDGIVVRNSEYISDEAISNSSAKLLPAGTLLVALYGATVGKLGILSRPAATNQAVCAIFPSEAIDTKFLFLYLLAKRQWLIGQAAGGAQPNISQAVVRSLLVPVIPRQAQHEIVAEIEKQFSRLDEAVANLQRVKANLKRYKASVLKDAVEGRLVPTAGNWTITNLGALALSVRNGYSGKPDADVGTRIFRISAVRPMELNTDDVRYLSGAASDFKSFMAAEGDVLFTRYNGSREYVGVCALVPAGVPPTVYPDKLIRVRVPTSVLIPAYVVIAASTGQGRDFIESKIRTTAGQSGISGTDIKAVPIPIPPLHEQTRIVAEVERRLSLVRAVEDEVDVNLKRARALRQSVLSKSFLRP